MSEQRESRLRQEFARARARRALLPAYAKPTTLDAAHAAIDAHGYTQHAVAQWDAAIDAAHADNQEEA